MTALGQPDMINSPPHYRGAGGLEAIDVIEAYGLGYHLGNAVKYIIRAGRKGSARQDLEKAARYVRRLTRHRERWIAEQDGRPAAAAPCDVPEPSEVADAFGLTGARQAALVTLLSAVAYAQGRARLAYLADAHAALCRAIAQASRPPAPPNTPSTKGDVPKREPRP